MAPAVGMLAAGRKLRDLVVPLAAPILLDLAPSDSGVGRILHIDHFGNATTNIPAEIASGKTVRIKGKLIGGASHHIFRCAC